MKLSQVVALLAVQHNNSVLLSLLSRKREKELEELALQFQNEIDDSRLLTKSTLAGLKRLCPKVGSSPRLSKVLISLGLPEKAVSLALSTPTVDTLPRVSAELEDLLQMGDSHHFTSCQATGNGLRRVEELIPYLGEHLFLWVLGERQSLTGDGFKARALLRVMYSDKEYTQPAGLYIDRPYGQSGTLLQYLTHLKEWWDGCSVSRGFSTSPILMPPVWQRNNGGGNDFQYLHGGLYPQFLYCPSAEGGYSDTLTHLSGPYDCFSALDLQVKNLHMRAYHERPWEWGVYLCSLREHVYNAQNCTFLSPKVEKEPRGIITDEERRKIQTLISLLGYPDKRGCFFRETALGEGVALTFNGRQVAYSRGQVYVKNVNGDFGLVYHNEQKYVYDTCPELGFWTSVSSKRLVDIPGATWWACTVEINGEVYKISSHGFSVNILTPQGDKFLSVEKYSLVVYQDLPELGFWKAIDGVGRMCLLYQIKRAIQVLG